MRQIDPDLVEILKTETDLEKLLRSSPEARKRYGEEVLLGSGSPEPYAPLKDRVSVGRAIRYVDWPPHRNYLIEISYMVSGTCRMTVGEQEVVLRQGDIFIPNQYTVFSRKALGEDDIMVSFIVKLQFLEELCLKLRTGSVLSDFMLDTLRQEVSWNRYLHFTGLNDVAVVDLMETMIYAAFPYLDDGNITCGSPPEPELAGYLLTAMFLSLSRNLEALSSASPANYDEMIRQTVRNYIGAEYRAGSLKELAAMVNQSESALSRQIKSLFGFTFKELLLRRRFERAVTLLEQTDLPVSSIAETVGYENTSFFHRRFRSYYGISPREFRQRRKAGETL